MAENRKTYTVFACEPEVAQEWSQDFAEANGLDATRVLSILQKRLQRDRDRLAEKGNVEDDLVEYGEIRYLLMRDFADAFDALGGDEAVDLFERSNAEELEFVREECLTFNGLKWGDMLYHTAAEVVELIPRFVSRLELGRDHLLRTGFPSAIRGAERANWFESSLDNLYWTKKPSNHYIYSTMLAPGEVLPWGVNECSLPNLMSFLFLRDPGTYEDKVRRKAKPLTYEEAPIAEGMSRRDAQLLEDCRPRFLEAKIRVLKAIREATAEGDQDGLWDRCLAVLTEHLQASDVDLLLRLEDKFYRRATEFHGVRIRPRDESGGLTRLASAAGDVESELRFGFNAEMRRRFASMLSDYKLEGHPLERYSYFHIVADPKFSELAEGMRQLDMRRAELNEFQRQHAERVRKALAEEFEDRIYVQVKRRFTPVYEPQIRNLAEFAAKHLETVGRMPEIKYGAISVGDTGRRTDSDCPNFSPGFRSACIGGREYSFTKMQAKAMECLWIAYQQGAPDVPTEAILETLDTTQTRLRDLFREHPAWNTVLVPGRTKGTFRLKL